MIAPILIMSAMGIFFGLGLALLSRIFKVDQDPRIDRILSILPGANCGACGKPGCAGLAEAMAKGEITIEGCPVGGEEVYSKLADALGVEKGTVNKKIARVRCGGGFKAKDKYIYQGAKTCAAAGLMAGGQKLCGFGCMGFGDCVTACPFDAIHMGPEGIPVVESLKCTSCGKCVSACPKNIISLENIKETCYVKCLSRDNAAMVRAACKAGCIACRICEKLSKGVFIVEDNLSRADYAKVDENTPFKLCVEKCPTKCIVFEA